MNLLRLLLLPFSLLYALIISLRNAAFDKGILRSRKFEIPIISIGNLAAGGSGKSPMTEYLIRLLRGNYKIATLSRGYGRSTTGFIELTGTTSADEAGDEPVQFKSKFPDLTVAVCEDRVAGINQLKDKAEIIILDDAYQHRAVKPGLSLLLFDYTTIYKSQFLLPAGNLREPLSGRKRADILIVTKCPADITIEKRTQIINRLEPFSGQQVFFSSLEYDDLKSPDGQHRTLSSIGPETEVFLLTGIANPAPLVNKLSQYSQTLIHQEYPDHHWFSVNDINKLKSAYNASNATDKLVITTEKDAQRLKSDELSSLLNGIPVFHLPIKTKIIEDEDQFNRIIGEFAASGHQLTIN